MSIDLSRPYPSRDGAPVISRIDPRMFSLRYFGECMNCTTCHDACCQFGVDIETRRIEALERYRPELETYLGVPRADWFRDDPDDIGIVPEPDYPGGAYTRTAVVSLPVDRSPHNDEGCVFLDPQDRGCRIHRFALERGIEVHAVKPMICLIFPLVFDHGLLFPAPEFEEDLLVCAGSGPTVYDAVRSELQYYFGSEFVAELDRLAEAVPPAEFTDSRRGIALPVTA